MGLSPGGLLELPDAAKPDAIYFGIFPFSKPPKKNDSVPPELQ